MATAPLFLKYRTRSGNHYVYDVATNEIVRIAKEVYRILDDYHVLDEDALVENYRALGEDNVRRAVAELDRLQSQGILRDHVPVPTFRPDRITWKGEEESLRTFMQEHSRLLTLQITGECNLRCEYCCYGEHYSEFRGHASDTMSLDTAIKAIDNFADRNPENFSIGFYGGEPLLEFELVKQVVTYAEELAAKRGLELLFNMTTNGTLLTDDKIHYLAEHQFHLAISLDGNRESHDRYRVFRNGEHAERKRGSYDIVIRNMRRFAELYPDYRKRGISLTITATSDSHAIDEALRALLPYYPSILPSFVRSVPTTVQGNPKGTPGLMAGCGTPSCPEAARESGLPPSARSDATGDSRVVSHSEPRAKHDVPEFCNFTQEWNRQFLSRHDRFIDEVYTAPDPRSAASDFPMTQSLLRQRWYRVHTRYVSRAPVVATLPYRCYAGSTRTFCSTQGLLYPCERTETGPLFQMGDAENGVDADRAGCLMEEVRLLSDCGNCVAKRFCTVCPSVVSELADSGRADAWAMQKECVRQIGSLQLTLEYYTLAMETNPAAMDDMCNGDQESFDWLEEIRIVLTDEQRKEMRVDFEELEDTYC